MLTLMNSSSFTWTRSWLHLLTLSRTLTMRGTTPLGPHCQLRTPPAPWLAPGWSLCGNTDSPHPRLRALTQVPWGEILLNELSGSRPALSPQPCPTLLHTTHCACLADVTLPRLTSHTVPSFSDVTRSTPPLTPALSPGKTVFTWESEIHTPGTRPPLASCQVAVPLQRLVPRGCWQAPIPTGR